VKREVIPALLILASCAHMSRSFVKGPQGRLHVEDGGRGDAVPVVFVHGNGANLTQWRAQLDHLRYSRRAVAFDLRGMGTSDPATNHDYSVRAMAHDLDAVADALALRRFVLVGHSYGGAVVAEYAAKHPERVAGVVFADAAGNVSITDEQARAFFARLRKDKDTFVQQWFAPILKPSGEAVQRAVLDSVHNTPVDVFAGALDGMRIIDMGALLAAYRGPRLDIAAADIESPSSLHVQFPAVPVKKMHGVGHWLMMDKPEEFNALLDEFLAGVR
jgi:pimeloyl-ACP methyl ester carboxylesterase